MKGETRSLFLAALAVGACFTGGWLGARMLGARNLGEIGGVAGPAAAVGGPGAEKAGADESRLKTGEWSKVLLHFGKGDGGTEEAHAMAAALLRMEAADFP